MLLSFSCLLLGVTAIQSLAVKRAYNCGGLDYHTTDNGVIVSHGGFEANHHYGKNMDCIWRIEAPIGQFVALGSESFDVEDDPSCAYDFLTLYDGNTTTSPSLGKFCGNSFNTISSTGRFLTLQFITDGDTQQSGFKLFYNFTTTVIHTCTSSQFKCANDKCIDAVFRCDNDDDCGDDSDEQNCNGVTPGGSCGGNEFTCGNGNCVPSDWLCDGDDDCNDNTDEIQSNCNSTANSGQCGATNLTGSSGEITSPNYPATYPSDSNCIYYIQADPGTKTLAFKFDDRFGLEADTSCSYDYVSIYTDNHSFNHGPFCGNVSPGQLTIPGDHAYVEFVSDDSDNYSGFRVDWKALQTRMAPKEDKRFIDDGLSTTAPHTGCVETIHVNGTGYITSPMFGVSNYPSSAICSWRLIAPQNETILLQFNSFKDGVRIFDGFRASSDVLGKFCGHVIPPDVVSTGHEMVVLFYSDKDGHEDKGFNITYSIAPRLPSSVTTDVYVDDGCHGDIKYLNESTGVITSPGYDGMSFYKDNLNCNWIIEAPPGQVIVIKFEDFLTERIDDCSYDYVALFDGNNNLTSKLAQFCGLQFPDDIISSGHSMYIHFASDPGVAGTGFKLTYEFRQPIAPCDMYQCGDGSCILEQMVCNKVLECQDQTDEILCANYKCGRPPIHPEETNYKIIGGREAIPHSWPWMVSLMINGTHTCGGTLIDDSWVVTAGHCFEGNRRTSDWSISAGKHHETKIDGTTQVRDVERIIVNPHYDFLTTNNDIAIVKLKQPFNTNMYVSSVCLPDREPSVGDEGFVTGWGYIGATCCPGVLKQAMVPIISNSKCNQPDYLGNQITDNMFCAGFDIGGHDACQGDSGGPLVVKYHDVWYLQGVTSFGSGCGNAKSPGVYTRVYNYVNWIRQKVVKN